MDSKPAEQGGWTCGGCEGKGYYRASVVELPAYWTAMKEMQMCHCPPHMQQPAPTPEPMATQGERPDTRQRWELVARLAELEQRIAARKDLAEELEHEITRELKHEYNGEVFTSEWSSVRNELLDRVCSALRGEA